MGGADRRRRPRSGPSRAEAGMRVPHPRARHRRAAAGPPAGRRDALAPDRYRPARRRDGGDVRPRDGRTDSRSSRLPKPVSFACSTGRAARPDEIVAVVPPDLVECTVEKVAVNAVLAGCRPVLPARRAGRCRGGMHRRVQRPRPPGDHVLLRPGGGRGRAHRPQHRDEQRHQRPRARATGRTAPSAAPCSSSSGTSAAVVRARSTGRRSATPESSSFCFAEEEEGAPWESLAASRGVAARPVGRDAVRRRGCARRRRPALRGIRNRWPGRSPARCERWRIRSCRSVSTPCWSCRPSTAGSSPKPAGTGPGCSRS